MSVFYKPADGFLGDVIPFYWDAATAFDNLMLRTLPPQ